MLIDGEEAEIWPALASTEPWGYNASKASLVSPQFPCGTEGLLSWSMKSPLGQFPGGGLHGPLSPAPLGYMPPLSPPPHRPAPRLCEAFPSPPIFLCLSESRALDAYIPMISFFPLLFPHHSTYLYLLTTSLGPSLCSTTQISFPRAQLAKSYRML